MNNYDLATIAPTAGNRSQPSCFMTGVNCASGREHCRPSLWTCVCATPNVHVSSCAPHLAPFCMHLPTAGHPFAALRRLLGCANSGLIGKSRDHARRAGSEFVVARVDAVQRLKRVVVRWRVLWCWQQLQKNGGAEACAVYALLLVAPQYRFLETCMQRREPFLRA